MATHAEVERALTLLTDTPREIASLTRDLTKKRLHAKPDEDTWSANDILAHLRACADVWGKSILAMIAQDHPTLRYVSPRTWIRKTNYLEIDFHASLGAFTKQRADLLKTMEALAPAGWSRGATFTGTVKGREGTVLSYAMRMADHECVHLEQLDTVLKRLAGS